VLGAILLLLSIAGALCACGNNDYSKYSGAWVGTRSDDGSKLTCVIARNGSGWTATVTYPDVAGSPPLRTYYVAKNGKLVPADTGQLSSWNWYELRDDKLVLEMKDTASSAPTMVAEFTRQ